MVGHICRNGHRIVYHGIVVLCCLSSVFATGDQRSAGPERQCRLHLYATYCSVALHVANRKRIFSVSATPMGHGLVPNDKHHGYQLAALRHGSVRVGVSASYRIANLHKLVPRPIAHMVVATDVPTVTVDASRVPECATHFYDTYATIYRGSCDADRFGPRVLCAHHQARSML